MKHREDCIVTRSYYGVGDNFLQRPFIVALSKQFRHVYLETPYPEAYWDLPNIKFIKPHNRLRMQAKHVKHLRLNSWAESPDLKEFPEENKIAFNYQSSYTTGRSFAQVFEQECCPLFGDKYKYTMPLKPEWIEEARKLRKRIYEGNKPCIWLYVPTLRKEFYHPNRLPKSEYMQGLLDRYGDDCFFFNISDLEPEVEWRPHELEGVHCDIINEFIPIYILWALLTLIDGVVTWHSWQTHACIALKVKCLCLWGGFAAPFHIIDYRLDQSSVIHMLPEPFCDCLMEPWYDKHCSHVCNKELDMKDVVDKFEEMIWGKKRYS